MSSILDVSSLYDTYSATVQNASASTLQSDIKNVNGETSDKELLEACKSFESYFVQQVLEKAKTALVGSTEEDQGEYMQYFGDILTERYADMVVDNNSIGLAQQLYDSVKNTYKL